MCEEWFDIIDFLPINNYISAYNTWGTSRKSILLENIFLKDIASSEFKNTRINIYSNHRKICRVHNIYDLQVALSIGATMIGIHAVISHKDSYYNDEKFYWNCQKKYPHLPIPDYEVEGIKYMLANLPPNVMPVLIIENKLTTEEIKEIVEIYGLKITNSGIQLQVIVDEVYFNSIMNIGFAHVIASVGITQKNTKSYLAALSRILRKENDYILIDMSKHQPNLIEMNVYEKKYFLGFKEKMQELYDLIGILVNIDLPILLADDLNPDELILFQMSLLSKGVNLVGLDMQNNIELNKFEQGYCKIEADNNFHYAKIRKSIDKVKKWQVYESYLID